MNLGGRLEIYKDGWPDQNFSPNGQPVLAGWNDPTYQAFIAPQTIARAARSSKTTTFAPRVGFAYDLTGDNRTVLKAFYGQFRFNSADTLADQENPVGRAQLRYVFNDLERRPAARRPAGTGPAGPDGRRRRLRPRRSATSFARRRNEFSTQPRARNRRRPLGPRVLRLQEHPQQLERSRHRPRRHLHGAVRVQRHRRRRRRRHRRRQRRAAARSAGRARRPTASTPTTTARTTGRTSTRSSSRSTAACAASGCCSPRSATPG